MITIIYAHPNKNSFNHSILESVELVLKKADKEYKIIDLYKENFNPVMKSEEIYNKKYRLEKTILKYQELISKSEKLIFIYPTWWNSMPAILKGFIDRVFTTGFAYKFENKMPKGLLKGKKALVISTCGSPAIINKLFLGNRNLNTITKDILEFCGIKTESILIGNVLPENKNLNKEFMRIKLKTLNFIRE